MNNSIKGVIPAAGLGTRFLPVTKTVAKEMLPIIDTPAIQYIVEEAAKAGLIDLTIVTSPYKESLVNYFDHMPKLEQHLEANNDAYHLNAIRHLPTIANLSYVTQEEQLGLGHAVLMARTSIGNQPFAVFLPDDVMVCDEPAIGQLLNIFRRFEGSVVALAEIPPESSQAYGVVAVEVLEEGLYRVKSLVEKPDPQESPSNLGIVGRYIFTPGIFDSLMEVQPDMNGEIQLTAGMNILAQREPLYGTLVRGVRYDVGNPLGMLRASLDFGLKRADFAPQIRKLLSNLIDPRKVTLE